jgi:hypothetical protein
LCDSHNAKRLSSVSRIYPRTIGGVARWIGDAGVNIEPAYTTLGAVRLTLGIDGVERRGPRCSRSGGEWDAP